jgi:acetolactate synthase-1/2/3 large subunit
MSPITKYSRTIESGEDVANIVHEAFKEMRSGRPGPAHLELPEDVAVDETNGRLFAAEHAPPPVASDDTIERAAEILYKAKSPLVMLGAAAERSGVPESFRDFAKASGLPYFCTWMAKGVGDEEDVSFIGSITMPGMDYVGAAASKADVILNLGHDVAEKAPFLMRQDSRQAVIHVNTFPAHADHIYFPQHQVVGDIAHTLGRLTDLCSGERSPGSRFGAVLEKLGLVSGAKPAWDHSHALAMGKKMRESINRGSEDAESFPAKPQYLAMAARKALPDDGIITLDNGVHKIWFTRNFPMRRPNCHLVDSALGSMGPALPAAIAAGLARPDRAILAVAGDGGFMMNAQELETAHRLGLNIVVLILNDNGLGMIRMKQVMDGNKPLSVDFTNPDFVKLAEAHGARGYRLERPADLPNILSEAFKSGGLHVIDAPVDYRENAPLLKEMKMAVAPQSN